MDVNPFKPQATNQTSRISLSNCQLVFVENEKFGYDKAALFSQTLSLYICTSG